MLFRYVMCFVSKFSAALCVLCNADEEPRVVSENQKAVVEMRNKQKN